MNLMPAQIPGVGGMSSTLLLGGVVFVAMLFISVVGVALWYWKQNGSEPWEEFAEAAANIVDEEDADAIAFIPYSDGPLEPKAAIYDKELLGGKGGYRTADGDRIYVDGQGRGKFSLMGTDVILAIDPTEHAAAADPLKAYIAHEKNLGRWIKVDREGSVIEAGDAVKSLDEDITPAMDQDMPDSQAVADGGYPSEVHRKAAEDSMTLEDAKETLEKNGMLHKIVDIAPPRESVIDDETGEVTIEEASHVAIDVSEASDLLPKKTNTTDWQTTVERARQEGRDEDKIRENLTYGIILGAAIVGVIAAIFLVLFMFA